MNNTMGRIRTASDLLLDDLEALRRLEEEKRDVPVGTPRFVELAAKVEELSRAILQRTERQRDLGQQVHVGTTTINATPREIGMVLSDWRDAERRLTDAAPGSAEADEAQAEVDRLRDEYRDAAARATDGRPKPA